MNEKLKLKLGITLGVIALAGLGISYDTPWWVWFATVVISSGTTIAYANLLDVQEEEKEQANLDRAQEVATGYLKELYPEDYKKFTHVQTTKVGTIPGNSAPRNTGTEGQIMVWRVDGENGTGWYWEDPPGDWL